MYNVRFIDLEPAHYRQDVLEVRLRLELIYQISQNMWGQKLTKNEQKFALLEAFSGEKCRGRHSNSSRRQYKTLQALENPYNSRAVLSKIARRIVQEVESGISPQHSPLL